MSTPDEEIVRRDGHDLYKRKGDIGERAAGAFLREAGWLTLPMHQFYFPIGEPGPKLLAKNPDENIVMPDIVAVSKRPDFLFAESKMFMQASWYGKANRYEIGIRVEKLANYDRLRRDWKVQVLLFALLMKEQPVESDMKYNPTLPAPTGLFVVDLAKLAKVPTEERRKSVGVENQSDQYFFDIGLFSYETSLKELTRLGVDLSL